MTDRLPAAHMSSSPATAGTRTHYGSPSTTATAMSSEYGTAAPVDSSPAPGRRHVSLGTTPIAARRNLTVPNVTVPQHLSPTAEEFTPSVSGTTIAPTPANIRVAGPSGIQRSNFIRPRQSAPGNIGDPLRSTRVMPTRVIASLLGAQGIKIGEFTVDQNITRAFVVTGLSPRYTNAGYVACSYRKFESLADINAHDLQFGVFSVEFYDVAEAEIAIRMTTTFFFPHSDVTCYLLDAKDIARSTGGIEDTVSNHQAEYLIHIVDLGNSEAAVDYKKVMAMCETVGKIKAFESVPPTLGAHMTYRVEFYDTRTNVNQLSGALISNFRIAVEPHRPDARDLLRQNFANDPAHHNAIMRFYQAPIRPTVVLSPCANHNVVDLMKIHLGQDVRTTIMLRNIPNRVDQDSLKNLLDQTSKGDYDFMYLRIDFANECNVGYAFINFVDPMAIVPFAQARAGKKWNLFQSDKIAEISYATIQGRDCLIQKFRNSSVMLERPAYRPKLYKTGRGPEAGTEEAFPPADNEFKLRRSLDNAETVGLYRPHNGTGPTPSTPVSSTVNNIRAPRNQVSGGFYNAPAPSRRAPHYQI